MNIHDILGKLRTKNASFLGTNSIETLYAFLQGYMFARSGTAEGDEDRKVLADFDDWVRKIYKIQSCQGWAKTITFFCNTQEEEIRTFWQLYDKFADSNSRNGHTHKFAKSK